MFLHHVMAIEITGYKANPWYETVQVAPTRRSAISKVLGKLKYPSASKVLRFGTGRQDPAQFQVPAVGVEEWHKTGSFCNALCTLIFKPRKPNTR